MLLWLAASLAWVAQDEMVRDGDEEGHVGAAELFRDQLAQGQFMQFGADAAAGKLGEYPPLYPALVGTWWRLSGIGAPRHVLVRGFNLLGLLLAAWAVGTIAGRRQGVKGWTPDRFGPAEAAAAGASLFVLGLPLSNGLARHFMPETWLTAAVALSVAAAVWMASGRGAGRAVLLGLALGAGMLIKQTFLVYALLPVVVAAWSERWRLGIAALVASGVAGPWYFRNFADQLRYGTESAGSATTASVLDQLAYYPLVLLWSGWGPVLTAAAVVALGVALLRGARRDVWIGLAWLLGGLVILMIIPKKYPRLLLPLAPAAGLFVGAALARVKHRWFTFGLWAAAATAWLATTSVTESRVPEMVRAVDPQCLQRWLRPPQADDLGLGAVVAAVQGAPEGVVAVQGAPEIPCEVQTTHAWLGHLEPRLRREGLEREVRTGRIRGAAVQVDWTADPGDPSWVAVTALGGGFALVVRDSP